MSKIGKQAFYHCTSLKKIVIKSKKLKASAIGKNAFRGVPANAVMQAPKSKEKQYAKFLKTKR